MARGLDGRAHGLKVEASSYFVVDAGVHHPNRAGSRAPLLPFLQTIALSSHLIAANTRARIPARLSPARGSFLAAQHKLARTTSALTKKNAMDRIRARSMARYETNRCENSTRSNQWTCATHAYKPDKGGHCAKTATSSAPARRPLAVKTTQSSLCTRRALVETPSELHLLALYLLADGGM